MPQIIEKINRRIPLKWKTRTGTVRVLAGFYGILCAADKGFKNKLNRAVSSCTDCSISSGRLISDMRKEFCRLNITPEEYARFRFFEKEEKERNEFLPDTYIVNTFKWGKGNNVLPNNKYERYCMVRQFVHRDVIRVHFPFSEEENHVYQDFISNKESFVLKPLQGTQGHGIQKINTKDAAELGMLSKKASGECLLEETITQGEELGKFHPSSVNTVRLVTGKGKDREVEIIFALLRVGKGGSFVDNVGSGGLVALIDLENGTVCTDAFCGTERFEKHPDTEVVFNGSVIPDWQQLCTIGTEIHRMHSGQRVFGFDFAWTDKGWDLVEVNPAPSFASFQALTQKGCLPLLEEKQLI